ncbi:MAG: M23 family metallopeptidase [Clostridia bacterium]|nr:M23 family metallopeptidase [Clostridia bacterium]
MNLQPTKKEIITLTLILFAAMTACTGILGLIPTAAAVETGRPETSFPVTEEVFSVLPEESASTLFSAFLPPLQGKITSSYGYRTDPFSGETSFHRGVDIAVPSGSEVKASCGGTVKASAYSDIGGNYIILSHENGTESYYGHLQKRIVAKGDTVEQGQIIGLSGATGKVTGAHLHFQLTYNGRTVDPTRYLGLSS